MIAIREVCLIIGIAGAFVGLVWAVALAIRQLIRPGVKPIYALMAGGLFFVSCVIAVGSQVDVISKLSAGGGDDSAPAQAHR